MFSTLIKFIQVFNVLCNSCVYIPLKNVFLFYTMRRIYNLHRKEIYIYIYLSLAPLRLIKIYFFINTYTAGFRLQSKKKIAKEINWNQIRFLHNLLIIVASSTSFFFNPCNYVQCDIFFKKLSQLLFILYFYIIHLIYWLR